MKLMMYLGNDLIESVSVNFTLISTPGYLGSFKRSLKQKYSDLIQQVSDQPEFLVVNSVIATKNTCSVNH
jgi:ABC-type transporter MlaC component